MPPIFHVPFDRISPFWSLNPALLYGLSAILGASFSLYPDLWPFFLVIFALLSISVANLTKISLALTLALSTAYFTGQEYIIPQNLNTPVEGIAIVEISSLKTAKSPFGEARIYRGTLKSFSHDSVSKPIAKNIPITFSEPISIGPKPVDKVYMIYGRLRGSPQGRFSLAPNKSQEWIPLQQLWTLAQWRYDAKRAFQETIKQAVNDPHIAAFLSGIAIGEFDDIQLTFELGRLGLQHLMAISGMHFSIIAGILAFFFGLTFGKKGASLAVVIILTVYFIFLGHSSSVLRAWVTIVLTLATIFVQRRNRALNSLGIGLLIIALVDPLAIGTIPFQFSFGVTASILLWFGQCDEFLERVFQTRSLCRIKNMHWLDQHAYCIVFYLRQGLALGLAVNLVALPITLFYFHKFPLMSLFYNLFFPFFVSFSMLLLIVGLPLLYILPPLGNMIFYANEKYTGFILDFVFNLPKGFDKTLVIDVVNRDWILAILIAIFSLGIFTKECLKERQNILNFQ